MAQSLREIYLVIGYIHNLQIQHKKLYFFPRTQLLNIPSDIYVDKQITPLNFTEVI